MNIKDLKVGDKVISLLGKTSFIESIIVDMNLVRLSRWEINVKAYFIEKVDDDATDIYMLVNEDTIFNLYDENQ